MHMHKHYITACHHTQEANVLQIVTVYPITHV